jgi:glycosyltransferase involved in cell wall biosynthesis
VSRQASAARVGLVRGAATTAAPGRRVALVAASLEILGGQGVQAEALRSGLAAEGYDVLFLPINPRFPRPVRVLRRLPYVRTVLNQLLYLPSLLRIASADVVHVFSASYLSFLLAPVPAMLMARAWRKRVVLHYHSGEAKDHLARWGGLVHPWLRLADEIVVPSEYLRDVFADYGYEAKVIRNVVDTGRFKYRERRPLRPRLLSARNLEPHYRVDDVLRAFVLVRDRWPDATLTVVGYGSEEANLRRLAATLGARGIRFVGRVEPGEMPTLYDRADIFVNASVVDNQPVSVLEAFAAGLPVVSTGTGDIASMACGGEAALIVPARDPAVIAVAVLRLLDEPELAARLAGRARAEAAQFSWRHVRREWDAVYSGGAA